MYVCVCMVRPAHFTEYGVVALCPSGVAHLLSHCGQEEDRGTEDQQEEGKQEHETNSTAWGGGEGEQGLTHHRDNKKSKK